MEGDLYPLLADDYKRAIVYYKMDYFLTKIKKHPSGFMALIWAREICVELFPVLWVKNLLAMVVFWG